jgi:molybdate transport system ATP-binding protein
VTGTGLSAEVALSRGRFQLDVRLDVPPGEVLAVLGPNGSGKSTLLDVLAGLVRPAAGTVRVAGRILADAEAGVHLAPHRRKVALLSQDPLLFPHLTVLANVAFGPRAGGLPRRRAEQLAAAWLAHVDLTELAGRRPSALSGGQAQRVALARALAAEPDVLLLDEPFAALDVDTAPALRGLVRRVLADRDRQATVLVTHDPLDALVLTDRVVVMAGGRVVEHGATREVLARPRTAFTARIAGLDLVPGVAGPGGLHTGDGSVVAGMAAGRLTEGKPAVAVFRPAAVAVHIDRVHGSPRNVFAAEVAALEPHGDLIRLRATAVPGGPPWVSGLAADLTAAAVAELELGPGSRVNLAVKATEVAVYPCADRPWAG